MQKNSKRVPHTYGKGDFITLKKLGILHKLAIPWEGPYKVMKHNNNGSIIIGKAPTYIKNVNVRPVAPYYYKLETPNLTTEVDNWSWMTIGHNLKYFNFNRSEENAVRTIHGTRFTNDWSLNACQSLNNCIYHNVYISKRRPNVFNYHCRTLWSIYLVY